MPELAEVEFYRKQWNCGVRAKILRVSMHGHKRIFRGIPTRTMQAVFPGSVLLGSEAHGKRMLFRFSKHLWLGLHLGMTGRLRIEPPGFQPQRHDHLVLFQRGRALVFSDPRLFGRVQFHQGRASPEWWTQLPPPVTSHAFTAEAIYAFLRRHPRLPIKAALLLQEGFPGIGNWMADEILWRAGVDPRTRSSAIGATTNETLWRAIRLVCQGALDSISRDFSDPPSGWLFHERWQREGRCPIHRIRLRRATIGGRTTIWCVQCLDRETETNQINHCATEVTAPVSKS